MKKALIVTIGSLIFLSICSLVAYITGFITDITGWNYLIAGLAILAASGIIAIFVNENIPLNIICSALSAVALGFCIRAWYLLRGLENDLFVMFLVSIAAVLCLFVYFMLLKIPFFEKNSICFTFIFLLISVAVYIVLIAYTNTTYLSTFGYYMLIELAFVYAYFSNAESKRSLLRDFTLSTYSVFGIAVLMALIVFVCAADGDLDCDCGGDCLDCCDMDLGKKKDKIKKK